MVLVKVTGRDVLATVADRLRSLVQVSSVRRILVTEDLGFAPTAWDLCVITQHRDSEDLAAFRLDAFHQQVSRDLATHVTASASVDINAAGWSD
jgi:hypothetical protein